MKWAYLYLNPSGPVTGCNLFHPKSFCMQGGAHVAPATVRCYRTATSSKHLRSTILSAGLLSFRSVLTDPYRSTNVVVTKCSRRTQRTRVRHRYHQAATRFVITSAHWRISDYKVMSLQYTSFIKTNRRCYWDTNDRSKKKSQYFWLLCHLINAVNMTSVFDMESQPYR